MTNYFEITRKLNWKNEKIWRLMGRITETHDAIVIVNMVTVYVTGETNIYIDGRRKANLI